MNAVRTDLALALALGLLAALGALGLADVITGGPTTSALDPLAAIFGYAALLGVAFVAAVLEGARQRFAEGFAVAAVLAGGAGSILALLNGWTVIGPSLVAATLLTVILLARRLIAMDDETSWPAVARAS